LCERNRKDVDKKVLIIPINIVLEEDRLIPYIECSTKYGGKKLIV